MYRTQSLRNKLEKI